MNSAENMEKNKKYIFVSSILYQHPSTPLEFNTNILDAGMSVRIYTNGRGRKRPYFAHWASSAKNCIRKNFIRKCYLKGCSPVCRVGLMSRQPPTQWVAVAKTG